MFKKLVLILVVVASSAAHGARVIQFGGSSGLSPQPEKNFCQGCRAIVSFASTFSSTANRSDYKDLFQNYCELHYPVSTDFQQGPCPIFVESLFYFLDKIDPVRHCDDVGACGLSSSSELEDSQTSLVKDVSQTSNGVICDTCEQVVEQMKELLDSPETVDQVKQQVDSLCEYLKLVGQDKQCKQLAFKYIDQAIEFIHDLQPLKYCQSIQLCSKKSLAEKKKLSVLPSLTDFTDFGIETNVEIGDVNVKSTEINSGLQTPNCLLCKRFVKEMFKFLKDNRTEESVRNGLDKVCSLIYKDGSKLDQCEHLVATYSKELVELLVDETDPELICMILEQCHYNIEQPRNPLMRNKAFIANKEVPLTASSTEVKPLQTPAPIDLSRFISMLEPQIRVGSMRTCVECKLFIKYLQDMIDDPKSQENMKDWLLQNLCDNLEEKELKDSCRGMVETNSEAFFKAVAQQLDPKVTCVEVGACRNRSRNVLTIDNLFEDSASGRFATFTVEKLNTAVAKTLISAEMCDECVEVVTQLDEYLSKNSIDHDVTVLVNEVCKKISNKQVADMCTFIVEKYGPMIPDAIANMASPKQLCKEFFLCT